MAIFEYVGPTTVQVFQDDKTYSNYLRIIQGDISMQSRYLLFSELGNKQYCSVLGILNILNSTSIANYDVEIGVLCKHTLYYMQINPYPLFSLQLSEFNVNNIYQTYIQVLASNSYYSLEQLIIVTYNFGY